MEQEQVAEWPAPILAQVGRLLLPSQPRKPPPPDQAGPEALSAYNCACADEYAALSAMRQVSKDWCAAATGAVVHIPRWVPSEQAAQPVGQWAQNADRVESVNILVPESILEPDGIDPHNVQSDIEGQIKAVYPNLSKINWQVHNVLDILGRQISWVITHIKVKWILRRDDNFNDLEVPDMIWDSVVIPESEATVMLDDNMDLEVTLHGPMTFRVFAAWVYTANHAPRDDEQETETRIKELTDTFGLSLETAKQVVAQVNEQIPTDYDPGDHVFFEGMDKDHTGSYYLAMGS